MDDRFSQQLKKGVLEMLVLKLICESSTYGYELLNQLKMKSAEWFHLKEGTLYPILYRLEDDGLISSQWSQGQGRTAPKKLYEATEQGRKENIRRQQIWRDFQNTVNGFLEGSMEGT
ncbi:MAG: PadR family transcriptional regulator [Oscillospiraceae bacterium]|nr:PadR family transcriptional regulator [Oscillospiraceae bacterium]